MSDSNQWRRLNTAGILLGLGLGGFFDGIVLHQLLQWHHMLTSAGFPPDSIANLKVDTLADGLFHVLTYGLTITGLVLLWQSRPTTGPLPLRILVGLIFIGWGIFNLVEGLINHYLLGIHHVRDDMLQMDPRIRTYPYEYFATIRMDSCTFVGNSRDQA